MAHDHELLDAFEQVFGTPPPQPPRAYDPLAYEDEDTLRRSLGGLSRSARREQRRPAAYNPVRDDEGLDADGYAIGAKYGRRT